MSASLHAALRLLVRWELWVLVAAGVLVRLAARWIRDAIGGGDPQSTPVLLSHGLVSGMLWCAWLGASMVLLLPLVRGGRGLDVAGLSRQLTTALAGGAIAAGTQIVIPLSFPLLFRMGTLSERVVNLFTFTTWLIGDLSVLLCAWYVHGKSEEAEGRHLPGPWSSAWKGLVTGALGLWFPGYLLRNLLLAADPSSLEEGWYALTMALYLACGCALPLVFGAWFMGALGKGEPREEAPA